MTAIDPGSPTDEDTGDEMNQSHKGRSPSLSPSPSSRSAHKLPQASKHVSFRMTRKRPLEDSDGSENPKKLTKALKGKQISKAFTSSRTAQSEFKRPAREMAPSFRADADEPPSSANTSFNTTTFSSQETANTVATSFTSNNSDVNVYEKYISKPRLSRTSSTTMGSLNDDDLLQAATQSDRVPDYRLFEQDIQRDLNESFSQGSSGQTRSTFGSVDEDGLLNASFEVENAQLVSDPTPCVKAPEPEVPTKMSYDIRDIPKQNLFVEDDPKVSGGLPYYILFICLRIALESDVSLQTITNLVSQPNIYSNRDEFWKRINAYLRSVSKPAIEPRDPDRLWQAEKRRFDGYTFKGNLTINAKQNGPVMCLKLSPVLADRSCRLQRMFGSDRFLYLDLPKFDVGKTGRFDKKQMQQIRKQLIEWLKEEHSFLGRKWRAFHIDTLKKGKGTRRSDAMHDKRIVLFATQGIGIEEPCTIHRMLNKFLPLALNRDQPICKAFARIDLGLSRTIPTLVFSPEQIEFVHDKLSTDDLEDTQFDDRKLDWPTPPEGTVMDDGCCVISVGAAIEIWRLIKEATGAHAPMPSAFQGRIGGAKGLWIISAEPFTKDPYHLGRWIKINKSQRKFNPPNDNSVHHRTFEVSNYSLPPSPSELHTSFIPILEDRGVPKSVISDFVRNCLEKESMELLEIIRDPARVYHWVYQNGAKTKPGEDASWQGGQPITLEEIIQHLLQSGFETLKCRYLAQCLMRFIEGKQMFQEAKLRISLPPSTFVYGVPDPFGVLKPGEIHLQFSTQESFMEKMTDETYLLPRETEVLVARQPACRPSDIQKVRKIVHPALSHLVDVAVFPSIGRYPLAGKLQGGDYDGDIVWICWEPTLVQPFSNAPAPIESPDPLVHGISTMAKKMMEIIDKQDPENVDIFLREAFAFRDYPSFLGQVIILAEKQAYKENRIWSPVLSWLYNMHDLLVDASKQGYILTLENYNRFVRQKCKNPKQPAYKRAIEDCTNAKGPSDMETRRKKDYRPNLNNILDYLYFTVVRFQNFKTMDQVMKILPPVDELDEALVTPVNYFKEKPHDIFKQEYAALRAKFDPIRAIWNRGWHQKNNTSSGSYAFIDECRRKFLAIAPENPDHPRMEPYLERCFPWQPCGWDSIKASALYEMYQLPLGKPSFIFSVAGEDLCRIKASSCPGTRYIVLSIRANLKPKPVKGLVQYAADGADADDVYDDDGYDDDDFHSALEDPVLG